MKHINPKINHAASFILFISIAFLFLSCENEILLSGGDIAKNKMQGQVDSLNKLSSDFIYVNLDTAAYFADSALLLSEKNKYKKGIALALKNKGIIGKNNGDGDAEACLVRSLRIGKELKDTSLMSSLYSVLGQLYLRNGDRRDEASEAYLQCLKLAEKIGHKELMATALNDLGYLDAELENYEKALESFQKALELYQEIDVQSGVAVELCCFAYVYSKQGKREKAIAYFKDAITIAKAINNKRYEAAFINNIATEYDDAGKKDSALVYYRQAVTQFRAMNDLYGIALVLGNIASIYQDRKQVKLAIETAHGFLEAAKAANAKDEIMRAHKIMSEVQALDENFKEAYNQRIIYNQLHDSIFNEEKSTIISELRLKYETEKKDAELLKKEIEINKKEQLATLFVLLALVFLVASAVVGYFYFQKKKAYKHLLSSYEKQMKCMNEKIGGLNRIKLGDKEKEKLVHLINQKVINEKAFCEKGMDINQCATLLDTNRSYLSNVVNDVFQKSFTDFINELRIKEACERLKDEKSKVHTLEAISESVGFSSRNTFTRNFKKTTGVTPSFYINNHFRLN